MPINIWVDIFGVGNNSDTTIEQLNSQNDKNNITFKSLDNIDEYKSMPIFSEPFDDWYGVIWDQVDLARLLVVKHLINTHNQTAIYADMDIDFSKNFDDALDKLEDQGAVIALEPQNGDIGLENQFFGFTPQHNKFLILLFG